jgi:hypothetical protein
MLYQSLCIKILVWGRDKHKSDRHDGERIDETIYHTCCG